MFENEAEYFFQDWSAKNITDPDLTALLGNNKVVLTAHQVSSFCGCEYSIYHHLLRLFSLTSMC